jgi:hypothetical protein
MPFKESKEATLRGLLKNLAAFHDRHKVALSNWTYCTENEHWDTARQHAGYAENALKCIKITEDAIVAVGLDEG